MKHADPEIVDTFYDIIKDNADITQQKVEICGKVAASMEAAQQYEKEFDEYYVLWEEDRQEFLRQFLTYGRLLSIEEVYKIKDEGEDAIKESPPTIKQFKEQIDYYEELYKKVCLFGVAVQCLVSISVCRWKQYFRKKYWLHGCGSMCDH